MQNILEEMYEKIFDGVKFRSNPSVTVLDQNKMYVLDLFSEIKFQGTPKTRAHDLYVNLNLTFQSKIASIGKDGNTFPTKSDKEERDRQIMNRIQRNEYRVNLTPIIALELDHWLTVCKKKIMHVRPTISMLKYLKTLQLCCNYLVFLPDEICELKCLYKLILARNRLEKLPKNIGMLRNLREFNIASNFLKELPRSMASLRKLVILNVNNNELIDLQPTIGGCKSLKYLLISNNTNIKFIPANYTQLPFLTTIEHEGITFEKVNSGPQSHNAIISLEELSSRCIMNSTVKLPRIHSHYFYNKISTVRECFYCGSAYFDSYWTCSFEKTLGSSLIMYRAFTCTNHFKSEQEYRENLFSLTHIKSRFGLKNAYPRLSEMFIMSCYSIEKLKEIMKFKLAKDKTGMMQMFELIDDYAALTHDYIAYTAQHEYMNLRDDYQVYNDI